MIEELKRRMQELAGQYGEAINVEHENETVIIGFDTAVSYIQVQYDSSNEDDPFFITAPDPEVATDNETYCKTLDETMEVASRFANTYSESWSRE
jgi:hypothetical protein